MKTEEVFELIDAEVPQTPNGEQPLMIGSTDVVYLSTYMQGLEREEIERKTLQTKEFLIKQFGCKVVNPSEGNVFGNKDYYEPLTMLGQSISKMQGCTVVLFVTDKSPRQIRRTRGCKLELFAGYIYGLKLFSFETETGEIKTMGIDSFV